MQSQQAVSSTPVPRRSIPVSSRADANRLLQGIIQYATFGAGQPMEKKREELMESLMRQSGRTKKEVMEGVDLYTAGAVGGARRVVESWFKRAD